MSVSDLARHGSSKVMSESYDEVGYNYRMTDMQAALGIVQLRRLDEMLAKRRGLARRYTERLARIPWLVPPREPSGLRHTYQSYMMRLTNDAPVSRDELMQNLLDRGVSTRRGIMAIHREAPYTGDRDKVLPVTDMITDSTIILPVHHEMTEDDHDYVVECIEQVVGGA
jgi:dTDP-4-amino-4,6-dideoxygalactose transaminase